MDITRELRNLVSTGEVDFGFKEAVKAAKAKKAKLVIISKSCAKDQAEKVKALEGLKTFNFDGTNFDLGAACGKPFAISMLTVISAGDSKILDLI
jgi:large subunit ribosomal protein L30e